MRYILFSDTYIQLEKDGSKFCACRYRIVRFHFNSLCKSVLWQRLRTYALRI